MVGESITRRQGDDILGRGELYSLHVLAQVHIRAMATSSSPTSKAREKRPGDDAGAMDAIVY